MSVLRFRQLCVLGFASALGLSVFGCGTQGEGGYTPPTKLVEEFDENSAELDGGLEEAPAVNGLRESGDGPQAQGTDCAEGVHAESETGDGR